MTTTISIVEDDGDTRENLVALLSDVPGLQCLTTYPDGESALRGIPLEKPDVALVDINLPGISGIECVAKLKARVRGLQLLILTTYEESDLIFDSLRAGANGYLLKSIPTAELIHAVELVKAGGAPMSMSIARKVVNHFYQTGQAASDVGRLTQREHEILALLAKGHLYKEIGEMLHISMSTVRTHVVHIYEKLHVQSRTEAAAKFLSR